LTQQLDVVVAGGGLSGLVASRDLADRGFSVVCLEAAERLGGRTYTRPFRGRAELIEVGGGWVNRDLQPHMRREIERYDIQMSLDHPTEHARFLTGGRLRAAPVPAEDIRGLERAILHVYDAAKRISPAQPLHEQPVRDLDVSADEFFAPLGLSRAVRDLVEATVVWYSGSHPSKASMLQLIGQVAAYGYSPYGFYGALQERFVGGTKTLVDSIARASSFDVRLSQPVRHVAHRDEGVTVTTKAGETLTARACVIAVPSNVMRHIQIEPGLSAEKQDALRENHPCRGIKLTILVENIPRHPVAVGVGALQVICEGHELENGQCLLIGFGAEPFASLDVADLDAVSQAVHQYFPEARVLDCDAHDWNRDPLFDGGWRIDRAGVAYDFPRIMNEPEGRIVFAGTDLDDSLWRTWMEGALNSGHAAAHRVCTMLGSPAT
jgi:monoamine oxidase